MTITRAVQECQRTVRNTKKSPKFLSKKLKKKYQTMKKPRHQLNPSPKTKMRRTRRR
jgi:hypothetical protein